MPFFKLRKNVIPRSRQLENSTKKNGVRHTIYNTVGDRYTGEWKDDTKSGKGVILTRHNEIYEGDMEDNYRHGFGILGNKIPNKNVYQLIYRGDWKFGKEDGFGLKIYPDGGFYQGEFKRGKRHGYGQMWYADGGFFSGYYKNDKREGLGVLVRPDGNRYEGEFKDDMKQGKGLFWHLNSGQLQDGVWNNDYCVFSKIMDIKFRQCAVEPTPYSIQNETLKYPNKVCDLAVLRSLAGQKEPCLLDEEHEFLMSTYPIASEESLLAGEALPLK